jgi:hypothetical protein
MPQRAPSISAFLGPQWLAQEKLDGVRMAVVYGPDGLYGVTKGGITTWAPVGLPDMPEGTVVDGELVGDGTWEGALSALRLGHGDWVPFDLSSSAPFPERLRTLREAGFEPIEAGPVSTTWERAMYDGREGIVIRSVVGGYHSPAFKVKNPRIVTCYAHNGFLFLLFGGKPKAVARSKTGLTGRVRVECEGATSHGNLRAARVLGPAAPGASFGADQLKELAWAAN